MSGINPNGLTVTGGVGNKCSHDENVCIELKFINKLINHAKNEKNTRKKIPVILLNTAYFDSYLFLTILDTIAYSQLKDSLGDDRDGAHWCKEALLVADVVLGQVIKRKWGCLTKCQTAP